MTPRDRPPLKCGGVPCAGGMKDQVTKSALTLPYSKWQLKHCSMGKVYFSILQELGFNNTKDRRCPLYSVPGVVVLKQPVLLNMSMCHVASLACRHSLGNFCWGDLPFILYKPCKMFLIFLNFSCSRKNSPNFPSLQSSNNKNIDHDVCEEMLYRLVDKYIFFVCYRKCITLSIEAKPGGNRNFL